MVPRCRDAIAGEGSRPRDPSFAELTVFYFGGREHTFDETTLSRRARTRALPSLPPNLIPLWRAKNY